MTVQQIAYRVFGSLQSSLKAHVKSFVFQAIIFFKVTKGIEDYYWGTSFPFMGPFKEKISTMACTLKCSESLRIWKSFTRLYFGGESTLLKRAFYWLISSSRSHSLHLSKHLLKTTENFSGLLRTTQ